MADGDRTILLCTCEDTMPVDAAGIGKACGGQVEKGRHLCRSQLDTFRRVAKNGGPVTVGCTQEAPLFTEVAEDDALAADLTFVDIRETAGWSRQAGAAMPKMAALIAAAEVEAPPPGAVTLDSEGVLLILGRGAEAIDAAERLKNVLDITVLLDGSEEVPPPRRAEFPIRKGIVRSATGHLGQFELTIDGYAEPLASSRRALTFGPGRNGAVSRADLILDLTGRTPLLPTGVRDGYLRADPGSAADVLTAVLAAMDMVGTFEKPRYVTFREDLCAHSRSRKTGCRRCLDVCPAGAITPAGDHVAIDAAVCGGCGACSAVCPTGAAQYALPAPDVVVRKLRALLVTYRGAGGRDPVVLIHDDRHGGALIDVLARSGDGLPANVLPLVVNEVTQIGLEAFAAAFAYGAVAVRVLMPAKPKHDVASVHRTLSYAEALLAALGYGSGLARTIETDDPDDFSADLSAVAYGTAAPRPATFLPMGSKREVMGLVLKELHRAAPRPVDNVTMPDGAPFGRIKVDTAGCTLCLSCVSACPTRAIGDAADRPLLRFDESLCVQCGLCQSTCPERVISLEARVDFAAMAAGPVVIKEEEPSCCITCGKPFGVQSTIDRIVGKLQEKHWMFTGENARRLDLVRMCDTCRITAVTNEGMDPYGSTERPAPKTTDDYLREREAAMKARIEKGEA